MVNSFYNTYIHLQKLEFKYVLRRHQISHLCTAKYAFKSCTLAKLIFLWIISYYRKEKKTQFQIMNTAHANVTADTSHQ